MYAENKTIELVNLINSNNTNYISMTAFITCTFSIAYLLTSISCTGLASNYKFIDDKFAEHSTSYNTSLTTIFNYVGILKDDEWYNKHEFGRFKR